MTSDAVPMWMIEAATERRLAGDVEGACAATGIDLDIDFAKVAEACGLETADVIADDLRHLAPDLPRWHMPRVLHPPGAIWNWTGVLRRYLAGGGANLTVGQAWKDPVRLKLQVRTKWEGNDVLAVDERVAEIEALQRRLSDHTRPSEK
ncbi:hypothetical protein [Nonomuraea sp. CA-141351]|uniref:hypothetical protein n=1 Tax=Nonomuraea sp. CA-141351 TaxID=3239996 RepID=UPI003D934B05